MLYILPYLTLPLLSVKGLLTNEPVNISSEIVYRYHSLIIIISEWFTLNNYHWMVLEAIQQQQHPFNGALSRTTRVSRYQKVKTNLDLLKQEIMNGSGISWAVCKWIINCVHLFIVQIFRCNDGTNIAMWVYCLVNACFLCEWFLQWAMLDCLPGVRYMC